MNLELLDVRVHTRGISGVASKIFGLPEIETDTVARYRFRPDGLAFSFGSGPCHVTRTIMSRCAHLYSAFPL